MSNDHGKRVLSLLLCLALFVSLGLSAYADTGAAARPGDGGASFVLFGKINGENYGCEGDWQNAGEYVFVNGKLTAKFDLDSYVGVKRSDNSVWYMTDGWLGTEVTSAVLYDSSTLGDDADKLYVPCDVWLEFTLTENADGSLTLSYERTHPDFTVTVAAAENGSVTADKTTAHFGDTVTLTVTPAEGYRLADLYYVREGTDTHQAIPQNNGQYSFPMPDGNVTVYAVFASAETHVHDGVTFTPWEATDSLPQTAGSYYLVNDVTLTEAWTAPRGVTKLCLNGRTVTQTGAGKAGFILDNSAYVSVYDDEGQGLLTGAGDSGVRVGAAGDFQLYGGRIEGNSGSLGGGVYVAGTFTMYGGSISGNEAESLGGGVYLHDADCGVNLNGGTISGNTAGEKGGGVYVASSCFLRVSGGPRVENNTADGAVNNVYLETGTLIVVTRALAESALLGVTTADVPTEETPVLLTSSLADKGGLSNFRDDTGLYELALNEDEEAVLQTAEPSYIEYPLWLGDTQVTSENKDDILGDGSVSYDPAGSTLHFTAAEPAITGLHDNGLTGSKLVAAQIYAEGLSLVIDAPQGLKLSTEAEKSCNIYMTGTSTLTVNGDLDFSAVYMNIYAYSTDYFQTGNLTISGATFGMNVNSIKITGNVDAQSGRTVLNGSNGTVELTGESIHVKSTDGSNTSYGISGWKGVTLTGTVNVESIDDCIKAGSQHNVVINGQATLKSNTWGIEGFSVFVNGDLNMETGRDGIYVKPGSGVIDIKGSVTGKCTSQYASYAVVKGQNITIDGDVNAESLGYGILAENGGVITVAGGTWTLDGGRTAIYAVGGIVIPETHSIVEPVGGTVGQYSSYYVIFEADGTTVAKHAVISDQPPVAAVTVSLDAQGGTVEPESVEITAGEAIGELPVPVREGWKFLGWFEAPAESLLLAGQGTAVTAESVFSEDSIIYAHWRLPGDINGDGTVSNKDVTRLQRWLKYHNVDVVEFNLDVNGDGSVSNKDLTRLQRYLKYHNVEIN